MRLIIKCNGCNEELIVNYSQITALGNIVIRIETCNCAQPDYGDCSNCEEVEAAKDLRREISGLKEIIKQKESKPTCFGQFKSTLSCCECLSRAECKKLGVKKS